MAFDPNGCLKAWKAVVPKEAAERVFTPFAPVSEPELPQETAFDVNDYFFVSARPPDREAQWNAAGKHAFRSRRGRPRAGWGRVR